tara:strand:+ start:714 stop:869 length:156 start_codon:yes stop_codon:yes gene_type:complete
MFKPEEVVIHVGFLWELKAIDQAVNWIQSQEGYKNKTVKYNIHCASSVDVD